MESKKVSDWGQVSVGDSVLLKDGRIVLVGNVNDLGGTCDDCKEVLPVAVVRSDMDNFIAAAKAYCETAEWDMSFPTDAALYTAWQKIKQADG